MKMTLLACSLALLSAAASANEAGLKLADMAMPHHDAKARVAIWYPSGGGGTVERYAANPVFAGVDVSRDPQIKAGVHPVVLFSHGMGGTDRAQAWLGKGLAERGAVAIMVNHPNSTAGDFDMATGVQHWTRAQDLTVALDQVAADPDFAAHLDTAQVMATGFSYGGWTALSLGGMTGNRDGLVNACHENADMAACDLLLSDRVSLQTQDIDAWNASYRDARVTQVVAIDPGFVWGLDPSDTAGLVADTILIGLGDAETRMLATDFDRSGLAAMLPQARFEQIAPALHFTAMPICTPRGQAILQEENDDPVCTDPPGTDRAAVHAHIIETIAAALNL
ncbi:MAG: hypothetical protein AAFN94_07030 [Pseudomonadota bacterium]